jgi:glyoxylate reductase
MAPGLANCPNAVLLPHLGSASIATRGAMARIAAENVLALLAGERPPNLVNPEAWDGVGSGYGSGDGDGDGGRNTVPTGSIPA